MKSNHKTTLVCAILSLLLALTPIPAFARSFYGQRHNDQSTIPQQIIVDDLPVHEAPRDPAFSSYIPQSYNRYARSSAIKTGYRPAPFKANNNPNIVPAALRANRLPAKFDLREENRVTAVRDQGPNGSCWAFATYASAESVLMPRRMDFSEKHLRNTHGYDWGPDDGGNHQISTAYLSRWSGPIDERDDPYDPYGFTSPMGLERTMNLDSALFLPDVNKGANNESLKRALMNYGAAYTTIYSDEYYLNKNTMAHYQPSSSGRRGDHAVTIVGWDDNFSRFNFKQTPPGDGAWIIKNSWGNRWGNLGGYYYVSYYDKIGGSNNCVFILKDKEPGQSLWYYDELGMTSSYGNGDTAYYANVFGPVDENTDVVEVGIYLPSNGASYDIYLASGNGKVDLNNRQLVASGYSEFAGYYTIEIDRKTINKGELFAPIVKVTTPGYNYPIPVEAPVRGYSSRARAGYGQSYISYNGSSWQDMTSQSYDTNVCVKAITEKSNNNCDIKVSSISFNNSNVEISKGEKLILSPRIMPENASNKKLSYSSSPSGIVDINDKGELTAIKAGTATVVASATDGSGVSTSLRVNVVDKSEVQSITLNMNKLSLKIGESYQLKASILPATANNLVTWTSSNPSVATVESGLIRAKGQGSATITAKAVNGLTANCQVEVTSRTVYVESISFKNSVENINVGDKFIIDPIITPQNASNKKLNYYASPYGLVSINGNEIEALKPGTVTISAYSTDGSYKRSSFQIIISEKTSDIPVTSISLDRTELNLKPDEGAQVYATIYPENASDKSIFWSSSNENVATVSDGYISATGVGSAIITAKTSNGLSAKLSVNVKADEPEVGNSRVELTKELNAGYNQIIKVTPIDQDGYGIRGAYITAKVTTPDGYTITRSAYNSYYNGGSVSLVIDGSYLRMPGEYKVDILVSKDGYNLGSYSTNFIVKDFKASFNINLNGTTKTVKVEEAISFEIASTFNNSRLSYVDITPSIVYPDGTVEELESFTTGSTGLVNMQYIPEYEGEYTFKIYCQKDGYNDVYKEISFIAEKPEEVNENALIISVDPKNKNYRLGNTAYFKIKVSDPNGQIIRNQQVNIVITGPNNYYYKLAKYTNYYGETTLQISSRGYDAGEYNIKISAKRTGYDEGYAIAIANFN